MYDMKVIFFSKYPINVLSLSNVLLIVNLFNNSFSVICTFFLKLIYYFGRMHFPLKHSNSS